MLATIVDPPLTTEAFNMLPRRYIGLRTTMFLPLPASRALGYDTGGNKLGPVFDRETHALENIKRTDASSSNLHSSSTAAIKTPLSDNFSRSSTSQPSLPPTGRPA
ncbi:hypothetical protein DXG01_011398 [Tephrocybe rancida]|nr:hypothetical protein DXG01_011398 [Tephrocybe rancida]